MTQNKNTQHTSKKTLRGTYVKVWNICTTNVKKRIYKEKLYLIDRLKLGTYSS